ncbi:SDR family NAD(P)-dependent oxidoreductase [candidate division KSB1 bacterium]
MIDLTGKTAVITGGSRGIGASCAVLFARAGADVAINYRVREDAARDIKTMVEKTGRKCLIFKADFTLSGDVDNFVESVISEFGRIDFLVNNHGIWTGGAIDEMSEETWDDTVNINLKSVYYLCNKIVPVMKKQKSGRIINVSSTAGQRGEAFHSHYAATKGAIIAFTKSLSTELAPDNILVNSVAPGWVDTDMCTEIFEDKDYMESVRQSIPLKRIPLPEDIAGPILFLASDLAKHITGEIINVNGGSVLCG